MSPIEKREPVNIDINSENRTLNEAAQQDKLKEKPPKSFKEFLQVITMCTLIFIYLSYFLIVKNEEIDYFYNLYLKNLRNVYEFTTNHYYSLMQRVQTVKNKKRLQILLQVGAEKIIEIN